MIKSHQNVKTKNPINNEFIMVKSYLNEDKSNKAAFNEKDAKSMAESVPEKNIGPFKIKSRNPLPLIQSQS